jgi:hypothetical protein
METTIAELDFQINQLKQSQNFNECLSLIERTIGIKSETYGKKSKEVLYQIIKIFNFKKNFESKKKFFLRNLKNKNFLVF